MLLIRTALLILAATVAQSGWSQEQKNERLVITTLQVGTDSWNLKPSTWDDTNTKNGNKSLSLANSSTAWDYRSTSPWLKYTANASLSQNLSFNIKYRADQSLGSRVDDLHFDWSFWPTTGIRIGVLDYKVNACRYYEQDSPWVRENNRFCNNEFSVNSTGGAPGIQLYNNTHSEDYNFQSIIGVYDPRRFNYAPEEYGNGSFSFTEEHRITQNNKYGLAFSAINTQTGTAFRVGYLHSDQYAIVGNNGISERFWPQKLDALYFSAETKIDDVTISFQQNHTKGTLIQYLSPSSYTISQPTIDIIDISDKRNSVIEISKQIGNRDVASYSYSHYQFYSTGTSPINPSNSALNNLLNISQAIAWRRDWDSSWFTSMQYMRSVTKQSGDFNSHGYAVGLRIGYKYNH